MRIPGYKCLQLSIYVTCFRRFFNFTQLMIFYNNQEYDNE